MDENLGLRDKKCMRVGLILTLDPWSNLGPLGAFALSDNKRGALGRAVEHSTSDHWVSCPKLGVFMSWALSSIALMPGTRSVTHKTLAVKKRRKINQFTHSLFPIMLVSKCYTFCGYDYFSTKPLKMFLVTVRTKVLLWEFEDFTNLQVIEHLPWLTLQNALNAVLNGKGIKWAASKTMVLQQHGVELGTR